MFGIFKDIAGMVGSVVGTIAGPIIGVSYDVIATTLGMSVEMVRKAVEAGCESYEDIKDFYR